MKPRYSTQDIVYHRSYNRRVFAIKEVFWDGYTWRYLVYTRLKNGMSVFFSVPESVLTQYECPIVKAA